MNENVNYFNRVNSIIDNVQMKLDYPSPTPIKTINNSREKYE